jgi:glycosyltransferase involved in cell wall biosynthesis
VNPRISLLLPTYNGERYLDLCLQSVLDQSMGQFELLIGDDCSSDATQEIIERYKDERITVVRRPLNTGLFHNLNALLKEVRAPIVRFLCQDDILEPECLEEELRFFERHPQVGMTYCKVIHIDSENNIIGAGALNDVPETVAPPLSLQFFLLSGCIPGNLSTVCVRKDCLTAVGAFDESYLVAGDYELWVRICERFDLGIVHKHLIRLRSHEGQLSRWRSSGLRFVAENRRVRSYILSALDAEAVAESRYYLHIRHNVSDVHYAVRSLLRGHPGNVGRILHVMGLTNFAIGFFFWMTTANNRLYKPTPRWLHYSLYANPHLRQT